ncbi:MAG: hypothetical protein RL591_2583, partial [Planctomycetota bacterium]
MPELKPTETRTNDTKSSDRNAVRIARVLVV